MSLDFKKLVQLVSDIPAVRITFGKDVQEMRDAVRRQVTDIVGQVITAHDWAFTLGVADKTTVANQAEYELKGSNKDCRDIINVRYGSGTSFRILDKLRPVDMDEMLTDRVVSGIGWWYVKGISSNGYPIVTIVSTPAGATDTIRYRYRKKDLGIGAFPDEFSPVLVYGVTARFVPEYYSVYERELDKMIDRYSAPGGEDNPAKLAPRIVRRNNRRGQLYGYSQ